MSEILCREFCIGVWIEFIYCILFLVSCFLGIAGYEPGDGRPKLQAWHNLVKEKANPVYEEAHEIAYRLASKRNESY